MVFISCVLAFYFQALFIHFVIDKHKFPLILLLCEITSLVLNFSSVKASKCFKNVWICTDLQLELCLEHDEAKNIIRFRNFLVHLISLLSNDSYNFKIFYCYLRHRFIKVALWYSNFELFSVQFLLTATTWSWTIDPWEPTWIESYENNPAQLLVQNLCLVTYNAKNKQPYGKNNIYFL